MLSRLPAGEQIGAPTGRAMQTWAVDIMHFEGDRVVRPASPSIGRGRRCSPRSRQARVRDGGTWRGGTGPARGMAAARRLAGHRDLRHALVRRLHGCAVLLCLLAALAFAIAVVSQKPALRYASALQVTTFGAALARTPAAKMGATTYLVPAITVLVSWALLGQVPSGLAILGGALCLAGVALSRRRPHAPAKREPAPSLE